MNFLGSKVIFIAIIFAILQAKHPGMIAAVEKYVTNHKYKSKERNADNVKLTAEIHSSTQSQTLDDMFVSKSRITQSKLDYLITKFIVNGVHPLSTVEEPGFVQLINGKFV